MGIQQTMNAPTKATGMKISNIHKYQLHHTSVFIISTCKGSFNVKKFSHLKKLNYEVINF